MIFLFLLLFCQLLDLFKDLLCFFESQQGIPGVLGTLLSESVRKATLNCLLVIRSSTEPLVWKIKSAGGDRKQLPPANVSSNIVN